MVSRSRELQPRPAACVEGVRDNPQNDRYHVAPSRGRRVLIIAENPEAVLTAIESSLLPA